MSKRRLIVINALAILLTFVILIVGKLKLTGAIKINTEVMIILYLGCLLYDLIVMAMSMSSFVKFISRHERVEIMNEDSEPR